jgi:hypothetical protein
MGKLTEFLKEKREKDEIVKKTRKQVIDEWLVEIENLFAKIAGWLTESIDEGLVRLEKSRITIIEQNIAKYFTNTLVIFAGNRILTCVPVARFVIGARGRVDIGSNKGKVSLLLMDDDWFIRRPGGEIEKLTKDTFEKLMMELI